MNATLVVLQAEFLRRIRSRPYLFSTILGAISVVLITSLPRMLGNELGAGANRIVLAGDPRLTSVAAKLLARDVTVSAIVALPPAAPDSAYLDAHGKAGAIAVLSRNGDRLRVRVYARDPSLFGATFSRDLAPLQIAFSTGMSVADVQRHAAVAVDVRGIGDARFKNVDAANAAKGVAYVFIILLYIAILLNAQAIMASVAEEKTSRIAELLVATIDPVRLLAAKVLASAATGVIQLAIWIAVGGAAGAAIVGAFSDGASRVALDPGPVALPPGEVLSLVAFFLVGFLQYAVLYAAAASLINRTEDLGSLAGPLVIPVLIGFVLAQYGLLAPNSTTVAVCSQIPLLAPFVMFTRIAVSNVPGWQVVLSLVVNLAAAAALAWLAGKVYRYGLLLYGRPPSFAQIVNILRT